MTSLYVFDFDGVLFDTARECLAVATEAAHDFAPGSFRALQGTDQELFLRFRHWVGPPWQYAVLLACIQDGTMPADRGAFLQLAETQAGKLERFTDVYFAAREKLARERERWLSVVTPYPAAADAFRELHRRGVATLLSTRDARSIVVMCAHFLRVELGPCSLLPRAGDRPKWQLLVEAARERELEPRRVFFLDDYVPHALPARERGISAHLATWGYLAEDDIPVALTAGLPCLQLSELHGALAAHEENCS